MTVKQAGDLRTSLTIESLDECGLYTVLINIVSEYARPTPTEQIQDIKSLKRYIKHQRLQTDKQIKSYLDIKKRENKTIKQLEASLEYLNGFVPRYSNLDWNDEDDLYRFIICRHKDTSDLNYQGNIDCEREHIIRAINKAKGIIVHTHYNAIDNV